MRTSNHGKTQSPLCCCQESHHILTLHTAIDTARTAFAPKRPLLSVLSSMRILSSMSFCFTGFMPCTTATGDEVISHARQTLLPCLLIQPSERWRPYTLRAGAKTLLMLSTALSTPFPWNLGAHGSTERQIVGQVCLPLPLPLDYMLSLHSLAHVAVAQFHSLVNAG